MTDEVEYRAERLSPAEIEARLDRASIVYLPLGALEFHGSHLPVGLDALTAHGVCVAAASKSGGVVLPPVYQGVGGEHSQYPWTIMMRAETSVLENVESTLARLSCLGVGRTVIVSGHFSVEQRELVAEISRRWLDRTDRRMRVAATTLADCEVSPVKPDHAGAFETLLLSALDPGLVNVNRLPSLDERPSDDPSGDAFGPHRHEPAHPLWGVFGPDPRTADFRLAPALLHALVSWVAKLGQGEDLSG